MADEVDHRGERHDAGGDEGERRIRGRVGPRVERIDPARDQDRVDDRGDVGREPPGSRSDPKSEQRSKDDDQPEEHDHARVEESSIQGCLDKLYREDPSIPAFQRWASTLSASDDTTLHLLGLPRAADMKEISTGGSSGLVIGSISRTAALKMLEDPLVGTILATEVAFDLIER